MGPRLSALSAAAQSTYTAKKQKRNGENDRQGETQRGRAFIKGCPGFQKAAVASSVFCPSPSQLLVLLTARDNQWCTQPDLFSSCFKIVLLCLFSAEDDPFTAPHLLCLSHILTLVSFGQSVASLLRTKIQDIRHGCSPHLSIRNRLLILCSVPGCCNQLKVSAGMIP